MGSGLGNRKPSVSSVDRIASDRTNFVVDTDLVLAQMLEDEISQRVQVVMLQPTV